MVIEQIYIYNIVNRKGLLAPGIGRLQNIFYLFKKKKKNIYIKGI